VEIGNKPGAAVVMYRKARSKDQRR
jgi:hypothetical protein